MFDGRQPVASGSGTHQQPAITEEDDASCQTISNRLSEAYDPNLAYDYTRHAIGLESKVSLHSTCGRGFI